MDTLLNVGHTVGVGVVVVVVVVVGSFQHRANKTLLCMPTIFSWPLEGLSAADIGDLVAFCP